MHYGDEEQMVENKLVMVVYKHTILGKKGKFDYHIQSIQECKYFPPNLLAKFIRKPNKHFRDILENEKPESWIKITIRNLDGWNAFQVEEVLDITLSGDQSLKLH